MIFSQTSLMIILFWLLSYLYLYFIFEKKISSESKEKDGNTKSDSGKEISGSSSEKADDQEGFVVVDEWPPKSNEQNSSFQPKNQERFFKRMETFSVSLKITFYQVKQYWT